MSDLAGQYNPFAKGLHWISALIVLGLLSLGFYMVSLEFSPFKLDLYWWHKSFGTLVFFLVLLRLVWRFVKKPPPHIETHAAWEQILARLVHVLLYLGMIGMPVSGILMSAAADFPRPFFGLFDIPDVIEGKDDALFKQMRLVHEVFAYCLLGAVGLHGLGAFKHHFIDRDITLKRMLPDAAQGFGALVATGLFVVFAGSASIMALQDLLSDASEETAQVLVESAVAPPSIAQLVTGVEDIVDGGLPHWQIIQESSRIGFRAVVQGEAFEGQFTGFDGTIVFDPENTAQSFADIAVQIASVQTGSDERDEYIVMQPWLFAESFPESRLKTTKIEKTDENQYVAYADLSMRGVTLPVEVPFTLTFTEDEAGVKQAAMRGGFAINRLDFGVGAGDWASPEMVENALSISISIDAREM